jgi:hypothetical protein
MRNIQLCSRHDNLFDYALDNRMNDEVRVRVFMFCWRCRSSGSGSAEFPSFQHGVESQLLAAACYGMKALVGCLITEEVEL